MNLPKRIKAALHRIQHGQPVTRIPAHETDADVVLMACRDRIVELEKRLETCTNSYKLMLAQRDEYWARVKSLDQEYCAQGYWAWQDDGTDDLDSLVCPVLISAPALRRLVGIPRMDAPKGNQPVTHADRDRLAAAQAKRDRKAKRSQT